MNDLLIFDGIYQSHGSYEGICNNIYIYMHIIFDGETFFSAEHYYC